MNQETTAESSKQAAAFGEDTVMHDIVSETEGSASEEEQQMADALLSSTPNTPFVELPEVPRRSSKRILCKSSEDPAQPEKRRKALALLVETRAAKSLKLADPNKAAFSSEAVAKDCFSISSGNYLRLSPFPFVLAYFWQGIADHHFFSYSVGSDLQGLSSPSSGCLMKSIRVASGYGSPSFQCYGSAGSAY